MICRLLFYFLLAAVAVNGLSSARAEEKIMTPKTRRKKNLTAMFWIFSICLKKEIRIMIKNRNPERRRFFKRDFKRRTGRNVR